MFCFVGLYLVVIVLYRIFHQNSLAKQKLPLAKIIKKIIFFFKILGIKIGHVIINQNNDEDDNRKA